MRCEVPELKRCCFCIPLRIGLIIWANIKFGLGLIATMQLLFLLIRVLYVILDRAVTREIHIQLAIMSIIFFVFVIDNVLCVVFLISAHKKLPSLMRIYYVYSLVLFGISTVVFMFLFGLQIFIMGPAVIVFLNSVIMECFLGLVNIILQGYFIVLVKSEIRKLSSNCQFRFQNNAVEAECAMIPLISLKDNGDITDDKAGQLPKHTYEKPLNKEKIIR